MTVPDPISWQPGQDAEALTASVPPGGGVYCLTPSEGEPHISSCAHLAKRAMRLAGHFGARLRSLDCWPTSSRLETLLVMYSVSRAAFPRDYARRLRLRSPWFLTWSYPDPFPHLLISNRWPVGSNAAIGPFGSREEAQHFAERAYALFQVRRCSGLLDPSPAHPGCIYGEMNQCLRPCQLVVNEVEYASEVDRFAGFLLDRGRQTVRDLTMARDRSSAELDFEGASQAHKRLERVREVLTARDAVIDEVGTFSGVALTPSRTAGACRLHVLWQGCWQESFTVDFSTVANRAGSEGASLDTRLREQLSVVLSRSRADDRPVEHLALFNRWFRSTWRDGEWFPFRTLDQLNYRKVVRHISKLVLDKASA